MSASLRIEIEPKGGVSPSSGSSSSVPPVPSSSSPISSSPIPLDRPRTFGEMLRERDEAAKRFKEDAAKFRKETGVGGAVTDAELHKRVQAENRQERDENWLARQEARAAKRQDADARRAEAIQMRNEDWVAKRDARDFAKQQNELKRANDKKLKEDERRQIDEDNRNPKVLAQRMLDRQKLMEATRQEYAKLAGEQKPGTLGHTFISGISSGAGQIAQRIGGSGAAAAARVGAGSLARMALAAAPVAAALGGVAIAAYAVTKAFSWSKSKLMDEAERIERYSPTLQMQRATSSLRSMRTDFRIAQQYGEQMAKIQDRESRMENAWRVISARIASFVQNGYGYNLIMDGLANIMEGLAGTAESNKMSAKIIANIPNLPEEMRKAIVGNKDAFAIGQALEQGKRTLNMLTGGDFASFGNERFVGRMFESLVPRVNHGEGKVAGGVVNGREVVDLVSIPAWWNPL